MPDLLAGLRPRPSTPVPGHWLLPCPEVLNVYVFGAVGGGSNNGNGQTGTDATSSQPDVTPANGEKKDEEKASTMTERAGLSLAIPGSIAAAAAAAAQPPSASGSRAGTPARSPVPPAIDGSAPATPLLTTPPAPSLLDGLRADPLERAWCALNSNCSEPEVRSLFVGSCAVIRPAHVPKAAADDKPNGTTKRRERELWVFSADEVATPEGCVGESYPQFLCASSGTFMTNCLELSRPPPISLAGTLKCAAHGHSLACLTNPACEPTFTSDASWRIFEAAAGEKLAWAMGMRIALLPGDIALGPEPFDVRLYPTSPVTTLPAMTPKIAGSGALVLTAMPRPPPYCPPFPPGPVPGPGAEPMVLRPLSLPALHITPQIVNPAQDARLCTAFDAALGVGWKAGRTESRVAAQARGSVASDWSVYFVPLSTGKNLTTTLPGAIAAKWRGAHGVITIWPTHLARPLAPPRRSQAVRPPNPGPGLGAPTEILNTATGLFDFFASYSEPEPEPEEEEEAEETEDPVVVEDDTSSKRENESVDDLFSAHSSSVEPEPRPEVVEADLFGSTFTSPQASALELDTGADAEPDITMDDVDDLFGDGEGEEGAGDGEAHTADTGHMAGASTTLLLADDSGLLPPSRMSEMTREDDPRNMITEDDFNFFDSDSPKPEVDAVVAQAAVGATVEVAPTLDTGLAALDTGLSLDFPNEPDGEVELEVATPETPKGERIFEPTGAEPAFEVISRPVSRHVSPTRSHPLLGMNSLRLEAIGHQLARHKSMTEQEDKDARKREEKDKEEAEEDLDEQPQVKKPRLANLVPPAFSPLQLSARRKPQFPYGLPSPAATISGLNVDLVERLKLSQRKRKGGDKEKMPYECGPYDYSASWDMDSDSDDTEDDSAMTTGAPPTPSSTADLDEQMPQSATFPPPPPPAMTDDEVEFDGGVCVGGEWAALKDDRGAATPFARSWMSNWVEVKEHRDAYPSPTLPTAAIDTVGTRLGDIDVDILANAVVRNRFFRDVFDNAAATQQEPVRPATILLKSGMALAELTEDGADGIGGHSKSYGLPAANVNVGYGGTVMRITAAGLRYWRELGLAPAGGPKNITAYAVCEPGDEAVRTAATFLKDIGEVYTTHQLGEHVPGGQEEGEEGEEGEDNKELDFNAAVVPTPLSGMAAAISKLRKKVTNPTLIYIITHNTSVSPSALAPLLASPSNLSFVHVVPAPAIRVANLMSIAFEVYDLFPRLISRVNLHGKPLDLPPKWLPYHAFTVPGEDPKPSLSMAWPQRNYDVLTRWRSVHASWAWLPNVGILVLAVTDCQGDATEVKAVKMDAGSTPAARAEKAWSVFKRFAEECATEWRLSICAAGLMTKEEIDGECQTL